MYIDSPTSVRFYGVVRRVSMHMKFYVIANLIFYFDQLMYIDSPASVEFYGVVRRVSIHMEFYVITNLIFYFYLLERNKFIKINACLV